MIVRVHAGPSVTEAEIIGCLPAAEVRPPVHRGDLPRAVAEGVGVLVIVDGCFHQRLAVSPTEILDGLRVGMRIYGCSSMGALRAVELEAFGMTGHGLIFEHIRECEAFRDDFVGQALDPQSHRALSRAQVELELSAQRAIAEGSVDPAATRWLCEALRELHFSERTAGAARALIRRAGRDDAPLAEVAVERLFGEGSDLKRRDALATLERVRTELESIAAFNRALAERQAAGPELRAFLA